MSIAKAKLFKTARIVNNFDGDATELFRAGDFVAVKFAGKGSFGLNFLCMKSDGSAAVLSENELENFVL